MMTVVSIVVPALPMVRPAATCALLYSPAVDSTPVCLVVQHEEPEGPYAIGDALRDADVEVLGVRTHLGETVPAGLSGFDGLVVMGGPMSAGSDDSFPSRRAEIDLLSEALDSGTPTLGVCLGAQLLALAAGGEVSRGVSGPEVGWGGVQFSEAAQADPLFAGLPARLDVLHWHSDTYTLPPGAVHLGESASYHQQAFRCGMSAWGLQFHLEVDVRAIEAFLASFGADALQAGTTPESIRSDTAPALDELRPFRDLVLNRFAALVVGHGTEAALSRDVLQGLVEQA